MPRIARVAVLEVPYHITQRGNGCRTVFYNDADRLTYLRLLARYAEEHRMNIQAYCLMSNHVHLIAVPQRPDSLRRALERAHAAFARYRNLADDSCGHVWQARCFSCPLDRAHLWRAIAYEERNPVRAGVVDTAEEYRWSSARAHLGRDHADGFLDLGEWQARGGAPAWREALRGGIDEAAFQQQLRDASIHLEQPSGARARLPGVRRAAGAADGAKAATQPPGPAAEESRARNRYSGADEPRNRDLSVLSRVLFPLDADKVDLGVADVFDRVRRKKLEEVGGTARRHIAAVEGHVAVLVAANEVAELDGAINRRPAMRMHRHRIAHGNARIQHAHALILKKQLMMLGRGDHRVQRIGPRPGVRTHSYCFLPSTCLALPPLSSV